MTANPKIPAPSWNIVRDDFFGGVAAGVVALPLALAFGVASGLGPVAGLYGAIAAGVIAGMFGGTPVRITGMDLGACDWHPSTADQRTMADRPEAAARAVLH